MIIPWQQLSIIGPFITGILMMLLLSSSVNCEGQSREEGDKYYRIDCRLSEIPSDMPSSVTEVHLDRNTITTIPPSATSKLKNCVLLSLSQNHLTKISQQMFSGLASLERLFLDGNNIFYIQPGAFSSLSNLIDVRLANNNLTLLPSDVFASTHPKPLTLSLGENPLMCNWRLKWVKKAEGEGWLTLDSQSLPECTNYQDVHWKRITLKHLETGYYEYHNNVQNDFLVI